MPFPIVPVALGAAALFLLTRTSSAAGGGYSQAPSDGSKPPVKEAAPPGKGWQEMPAALQEQVAAALGELGVSPATGKLGEGPVSANAIKMATQTAALCEAQGFYEIAKQLRAYAEEAARAVPTPASAVPVIKAAPPGLTEAEKTALGRTLEMERDPKVLAQVLARLKTLPPSPERDHFCEMLEALILQLHSAQSTTQTLQQIDQVIKSPGIAEVYQAVQPLPPAPIPVMPPPPPPPPAPAPKPIPPAPPVVITPAAVVPAVLTAANALTHAALLPLTGTAILKQGSKGPQVTAWQNILRLDGFSQVVADGAFGPVTTTATKAWQKQRRLKDDGQVGKNTRAKVGTLPVQDLGVPVTPVVTPPSVAPVLSAPTGARIVFANIADPTPGAKVLSQATATSAEARSWQNILTALGYGSVVGPVDGQWGAKTTAATRALQSYAASVYRDSKPITADGTVGPQTRRIVIARTAELKGTTIAGVAA